MPKKFFISSILTCASFIAAMFFFCACKDSSKKTSEQKAPFSQSFEITLGGASIKARMAVLDVEKARGLMNVKYLEENSGMFFIYDAPQKVSFWMKDTLIPLDIAFFDKNGILTEIKRMHPMNLNSVPSSRDDIMFCLETNAGWFEKNGVKISDKLNMREFLDALKARGKTLNLKN